MAAIDKKNTPTLARKQPEFFSDFLTDLDVQTQKKDLSRAVNEEAIKISIKNLLLTNRGDRFFNNTLGSDIRTMLFENYSPSHEDVLEDLITTTVSNYEPRARVNSVDVSFDDTQNYMTATINFSIINKQEPIILDFVLSRIR